MASPQTAALLNFLSGGVQGFAESQRRTRERKSDVAQQNAERQSKEKLTEEELAARENADIRQQNFQSQQGELTRTQNERQFNTEQTRLGEESKRRAKYEGDMLAASTTIEQLQARIAKLQQQTAEEKFDPYIQIQKAVAEVYTKNATGDTPEVAGAVATKAATDLYAIYQGLGIIPTPIGPPPGGDTGVTKEGINQPNETHESLLGGGPAYLTVPPNNPFLTIGAGQIAFGRTKAKALADSLRSLGNATGSR
jgi:hypothetical protein